jgi:hypothetical protein
MKTLKEKLLKAGVQVSDFDGGIGFTLPALSETEVLLYDKISAWHFADKNQKISLLWVHINGLVVRSKLVSGLDENAHAKISMWIALGQLPQWRVDRLAQLDAWSDGAWMTYYALKEQLLAGDDVELPESLPPCPVTFAQLLFEKHV